MSCPGIEELEQYVAGALDDSSRGRIERHFQACGRCSDLIAEVQAGMVLAGRVAACQETIESGAARERDAPREAPRSNREVPKAPAAESFPGYTITRELSRGGQGVVYLAIQQSTKRKVAIKVLREGHFADARETARFEREVQILGQLKHPHIVTIYDSGGVGGNAYYVMDYVPGKPLDEHVSDQRLSQDETLQLFAKICDAVHAAHLRGIIHRDLKPSNIRVDPEGEPRVLDFGLAKLAGVPESPDTPAMTMTGQFLGSLPWSSPEQAEGQPSKLDIRTDVYSLGVVLYRLLAGKFPYDPVGNLRDVLDRIQHTEPSRPSVALYNRNLEERDVYVPTRKAAATRASARERAAVPRGAPAPIDDELDTIVLKCLAKERDRRYQSAGELARDIRHYLAGEPIEAKRDSGLYILRKTLRRHWRTTAALGSIGVLVLTGSIVSLVLFQRASVDNRRAMATMQFLERVLTMPGERPSGSRPAAGDPLVDSVPTAAGAAATKRPSPPRRSPEGSLRESRISDRKGGPPDHAQRSPPREGPAGRSFRDVLDGAVTALERGELRHALDAEGRVRIILGRAYLSLGSFDAAEPQFLAAVEIGRRLGGDDARLVADSLHELGDLNWQRQNIVEAGNYLRDALPRRERVHGSASPQVGRTLALLGMLDWRNGNHADARARLERAVEIFDQYPQDRLGHAAAITGLGLIHEARGDLDDAQRLFYRATEVRQQDELAPPMVTSEVNAARVAMLREDFARALELLNSAEARLKGVVPPNHPEFIAIRFGRAELHLARKEPDRGESMLRAILADAEQALGPRNPDVALYRRSYGRALLELGRLDAAERELRESLEIYREVWPQRTEVIANAASVLGDCVRRRGRFTEAEGILLTAHNDLVTFNREYYFNRISDSARRVVALYEAWHTAEPNGQHDRQAADWRAKLAAILAATQPAIRNATTKPR